MSEREAELARALAVVWFAADATGVPSGQQDALARAVRWQSAHPEYLLYVEGYDEPRARAQRSMLISEQRAEAVRDQLVRLGADCSRIVVVGYGAGEPLASRADDRRVIVRGSDAAYPGLVSAQDAGACARL
jgi:outer membrane protein OmpA-like peptidoglycan-associated protein